jgi:hypothetical protein
MVALASAVSAAEQVDRWLPAWRVMPSDIGPPFLGDSVLARELLPPVGIHGSDSTLRQIAVVLARVVAMVQP